MAGKKLLNIGLACWVSSYRLFEDEALLDRVPTAFLMLGGSLAALQFIGILLLNQKPEPKNEVTLFKSKEFGVTLFVAIDKVNLELLLRIYDVIFFLAKCAGSRPG